MATFKNLLTFFHHLLEEFELQAENTQGILLHTVTQGKKEKVFVDPLALIRETGLTRSEIGAKLTRIKSLHPGIYRRGEYYSYSEELGNQIP
jgi:hypothetical protein